jgi:hypothetical protein
MAFRLTMSLYAVSDIARRVGADADFRTAVQRDPEGAISEFDLSDVERRALLAGDVATLLRLGAHGYLLTKLAANGVFGLSPARYVELVDPLRPNSEPPAD